MDRRSFLKALYGVSVCAVVPALALKADEPEFTKVLGFARVSDHPHTMNVQNKIYRYKAFSQHLGGEWGSRKQSPPVKAAR